MKQHSHIRTLILPWLESRLTEEEKPELDEHLRSCGACRQYFETLSRMLAPAPDSPKDTLEADPYLITRIKAANTRSAARRRVIPAYILRWTVRTALFAVAVAFGIFMGEELSYQPTVITDQKIVAEFSASLDAGGIGDRLQTVAQGSGEASK